MTEHRPETPPLSLIVLSWNNLDFTRACVDSLRRNTDVHHELIVVDNGSTDGSREFGRDVSDKAVTHTENLGFAAGMNSGLRVASGSYVAFINNDTTFPPAWASQVLETFESHEDVGIVAPAVTAAGNPVTVRETPGQDRIVLTPFGELPSGVVYVMPTGLIKGLGGWNEDYKTASAEDLDLAFTVWAHGYSIVVDERVLIQHESQASVRKLPDRKALYRENLEQFLDRWESIPLGSTPLVGSIDPETFKANQERARTAVIWIRRMLEAREQARDLAARLESGSKPKKRRYWLISRS
ncbi:MAG TPA: glycosyltransferase family 2 protein [Acidimicrobiia bacterium]